MPHPTIHAVCLASSGRALSGTCSGPAAFVNNRKKTSPHESILSGIKSRFGALARYVAALDEKAAARLSAADHPHQAVKRLETLLPLPETGTLLHFEAGDGGFLEAFHAARPGWELSAIESGDAFMRLLKKAFLRSAYNADYRDADIVSRFDIIAVTKPLDEVEKPLNAVPLAARSPSGHGLVAPRPPDPHRQPYGPLQGRRAIRGHDHNGRRRRLPLCPEYVSTLIHGETC